MVVRSLNHSQQQPCLPLQSGPLCQLKPIRSFIHQPTMGLRHHPFRLALAQTCLQCVDQESLGQNLSLEKKTFAWDFSMTLANLVMTIQETATFVLDATSRNTCSLKKITVQIVARWTFLSDSFWMTTCLFLEVNLCGLSCLFFVCIYSHKSYSLVSVINVKDVMPKSDLEINSLQDNDLRIRSLLIMNHLITN